MITATPSPFKRTAKSLSPEFITSTQRKAKGVSLSDTTRYGTLDTTFGTNGRVTQNYQNSDSAEFRAVVIQPDGKIVVAGFYNTGTNYNFITARFNSNGAQDTTFNGNGSKAHDVSGAGRNDAAYAVALQSDGKIVVAGYVHNGSNNDFVVVRLNSDGSNDTGFDTDGIQSFGIYANTDEARALAIQTDGKIVVGGYGFNGANNFDFVAVRLNPNGSIDNSFDTNGVRDVNFSNGNDEVYSIAIQNDGKIILAGRAANGTFYDFALVRLHSNGTFDTSFDSDGKQTTNFGTNSYIYGIIIQPDGKIVAAGVNDSVGSQSDFALARYNVDGSLDNSFDGDGKATFDISGGSNSDIAFAVALQSDGKIVAAGSASNGSNNDIAVARFLPGADCTYSISPTSANVSASASNNSITVTTNESYCAWTATSNDNWLIVTGGASGAGNNTVSYTAAANPNSTPRSGTISVGGQTFTVNQAGTAINVSIQTGLTSLKNTTLTVPVNVGDTTGTGIISYDFRVTYDPALLTPLATPFDKTGTLSSGFEVNVNTATPGTVIVSGFGSTALSGMGTLLNLKFNTVGDPPNCGALNFTSFQFNEGNPASATTNGQACVIGGAISGRVTYANAPQQTFVPNVTLAAAGSVNQNAVTDCRRHLYFNRLERRGLHRDAFQDGRDQ